MIRDTVPGSIFEDNASTIQIAKAGYSPQLRHLQKHHRISLGLVHDFLQHDDITIQHVETIYQKGDLFTKGLSPAKLSDAKQLVRLFIALGFISKKVRHKGSIKLKQKGLASGGR